jgi:hypothetical protein
VPPYKNGASPKPIRPTWTQRIDTNATSPSCTLQVLCCTPKKSCTYATRPACMLWGMRALCMLGVFYYAWKSLASTLQVLIQSYDLCTNATNPIWKLTAQKKSFESCSVHATSRACYKYSAMLQMVPIIRPLNMSVHNISCSGQLLQVILHCDQKYSGNYHMWHTAVEITTSDKYFLTFWMCIWHIGWRISHFGCGYGN